jgi:hypothetical protein
LTDYSVATKVQAPNVRIAGGEVTVDVPAETRNFDRGMVGDTLMIRYTTSAAAK